MSHSRVASLATYLDARRALVEAALERYFSSAPACPPIVSDAMRYSLFAGGKRLRPILALAAAESVATQRGASPDQACDLTLPAACAIEMIHTYSLVHDDLPAMDNDSLRRGRPTLHVVYGDGIAILAGDGLLTDAFALLAREPRPEPSAETDATLDARTLRVVRVVAHAAGSPGMVGGQAVDLQAAKARSTLDAEALDDMHRRKTGALIRASAVAGAVMGGAGDDTIAAIDEYARHLGLAFQIVDDMLDVSGASSELGKTAGKDAAAGKPTYPALHGLERSRRRADRCLTDAVAALESAGLAGGRLAELADWVVNRTS